MHPRARGESSQKETSPPHPNTPTHKKTPHVRLAQEKKGRELVCTSSRKLLRRSPVKVAVSVVHRAGLRLPGGGLGRGWVECWGARRDVDRWLPRGAGARAALGRLALIPSRKLLHRSPVKVAVPATNRAGLRLPGGWAVGGALERWWASSSGQHVETCTGGRRGCVRAWRRRLDGPADEKWRPLLPLHSKVGQQGAPAEPRRLPHPPGTGLAAPVGLRRLAHRALVAQP